ncbi:hypothetical protein CH063_06780 [Colletotrichum higginsianum]|uniref:Uncharacterized protein n=1 Tax=Colletotrichum higginsianum (strain IMI 349063) TaxID=759273 RepID=H1V3S1_COLHI|nr:hypothetical protein CH063_06780 [Colletotrichum higginsianum]
MWLGCMGKYASSSHKSSFLPPHGIFPRSNVITLPSTLARPAYSSLRNKTKSPPKPSGTTTGVWDWRNEGMGGNVLRLPHQSFPPWGIVPTSRCLECPITGRGCLAMMRMPCVTGHFGTVLRVLEDTKYFMAASKWLHGRAPFISSPGRICTSSPAGADSTNRLLCFRAASILRHHIYRVGYVSTVGWRGRALDMHMLLRCGPAQYVTSFPRQKTQD